MSAPYLTSVEEATWGMVYAGSQRHAMPVGKRLVRGVIGGMLISVGGMLVNILSSDPWLADNTPGLLKVIEGSVFPVGLVMITLLQVDMLTSEMAYFIAATVKRRVPWWAFLYGWAITFVGNLAGSLLWAGILVHYAGIYTTGMESGAASTAVSKVATPNFLEIWIRGIGCNFLVCIAVFQGSLAKDMFGKIAAIWFPIACFVSAGFEHVVANMFLVPEGLMTGRAGFGTGTYIWKSIIASFLGNVVGAALLVLPLIYLHATDETDPARLVGPKETPSNGSVQGATVANSVLVDGDKIMPWTSDVESQRQISRGH